MVAQGATQVEVSATATLVDDTKNDVSSVINPQQIQDLPVNGRRVDSFVLLTPGVTNDATFGLLTFRGVAGNNSFLIDGNDNTEQFYDENAGRTRIQSQISQDAVQEFQVVSDDYLGGIRPRHGRRGQHRHQERHQRSSRQRLLLLPQHRIRRPRSLRRGKRRGHQSDRETRRGRRTVGGAIIKDKLFLLRQLRSHPPQVSPGGQLRQGRRHQS